VIIKGGQLINKGGQGWKPEVVSRFSDLYRMVSINLIMKFVEPDNTDIMVNIISSMKEESEIISNYLTN
jgi:hypothetical protein